MAGVDLQGPAPLGGPGTRQQGRAAEVQDLLPPGALQTKSGGETKQRAMMSNVDLSLHRLTVQLSYR